MRQTAGMAIQTKALNKLFSWLLACLLGQCCRRPSTQLCGRSRFGVGGMFPQGSKEMNENKN
jgi:hypothetical protein